MSLQETEENDISAHHQLLMALQLRYGPGAKILHEIAEAYARTDITECLARLDAAADKLGAKDWDAAASELELAEEHELQVVSLFSSAYPKLLCHISSPPLVLFVRSEGPVGKLLQEPAVAIVGSRVCSEYGRCVASSAAKYLSERGVHIISGLARGIDGSAHTAVVNTLHSRFSHEQLGRAIAILGSGVLRIYPSEHEELAQAITANGGLIISEYGVFQTPKRHHFPLRNRIISGLSAAVLVVEGRARSGSVITARLAAEQGRDVFAVPGALTSEFSQAPHELLRTGAILYSGPEDFQEVRSLQPLLKQEPKQLEVGGNSRAELLNDVQRQVYEAIKGSPSASSVDELCGVTGLTAASLRVVLMELEMTGVICGQGHDRYSSKRFDDGLI